MRIYDAEMNWKEAITGINTEDGVWLRYEDEWFFVPDRLTADEYLSEAECRSNEEMCDSFTGTLRCQNCGKKYSIGDVLQYKTCPVYSCRGWLFRVE